MGVGWGKALYKTLPFITGATLQDFRVVSQLDAALLSVGGISMLTTSYRAGCVTESDRRSLIAAGDVLCNFMDAAGALGAHDVNDRVFSANRQRLRRPRNAS